MHNNSDSKKCIVIKYVVVFIVSLIVNMLVISGNRECRLTYDDIGILATAAKVAGYKWDSIVKYTSYYGPAYSALLAPILKLSISPEKVWTIIVYINLLLVSFGNVILYHIGRKYMCVNEDWIYTIFAIFSSVAFEATPDMGNEQCIYLVTILVVWLILAIEGSESVYKKVILQLLTLLVLGFSYLCHSRCIVLALMLIVTILWFWIFRKTKIGFVSVWTVGILGEYLLSKKVRNFVVDEIWNVSVSSGDTINNLDVSFSSTNTQIFTNINYFKAFIATLFGNYLKGNIETFGILFVITAVLFILIFRRKIGVDAIELTTIFSLGCAIAGIVGIAVIWGSGAAEGIINNTDVYAFKGVYYYRYFAAFLAPGVFAGLIYVYQNVFCHSQSDENVSIKIPCISFVLFVITMVVWYFVTNPVIMNSEMASRLELNVFHDSDRGWINYHSLKLSFLLMVAFLVFYMFCSLRRNIRMYKILLMIGMIGVLLVPIACNKSIKPYSGVINSHCDIGYDLINDLHNAGLVDRTIYMVGENKSKLSYQFNNMRYEIVEDIPLADEVENLIVFANNDSELLSSNDGFEWIQLDNNESVYVKGDLLKDFVNEFLKKRIG